MYLNSSFKRLVLFILTMVEVILFSIRMGKIVKLNIYIVIKLISVF